MSRARKAAKLAALAESHPLEQSVHATSVSLSAHPTLVVQGAMLPILIFSICGTLAGAAALDISPSARPFAIILVTASLALCAFQISKRLLWATAVAAAGLTIAAGLWGPPTRGASSSRDQFAAGALLAASLFTLTAFMHLWMRARHLARTAGAEIAAQGARLAVQNELLRSLMATASDDKGQRQAADAHLMQMEARYRGLLEAAPDAMVVVDQAGAIVLLNAQAEKTFGYRRDELLGQQVRKLIPEGFAERLIADDARTAAEALAQQIGSGIELIGRRKDASSFPMELMLSPLESDEGILVTAAIRDVTARQADQDALRASEEWHRMAVEVAEIGTWSWDIATNEVTTSDQFQKLTGLTSEKTRRFDDMFLKIHAADMEHVRASVDYALASNQSFDVEFRISAPDGGERWISSKGRVRRGPEGAPQSMQGTILDVTERRAGEASLRERPGLDRTSAELKRSNADLQQFAYVAAHDLQEPLRMVSSYTQLLAERYRGRLDAKADEFINFAVDGSLRMKLLIADLLAYCQVETAGRELHETSAADALSVAIENLQGAIKESGGVVTRDALPTLTADPGQLTQLFQNLIGNALKYRGVDPPRVHVSAKQNRSKEWVLSVRDNGLGIDPKYFARIFLMFQRLHARDAFSGTGIGLSLCRKIAERHGGRIWLKSAPKAGSTFYVAFPARGVSEASPLTVRSAA